jgi:flagellar protein FliL
LRFRAIVISSALALSLLLPGLPAAAAEHGGGEKPAGDGPVFVTLNPIVLPVFEGNKVTRRASIGLALELEKGKSEADVEKLRPKLIDAFITDLHDLYEERRHEPRIIEPSIVKPRLQETANRVLGPGIVHDVLIQSAMEGRQP